MNQAIWKLAYRHVHHYQKNYLFISIVVLFMSMSFITTIICYKNYYEVKKLKDINDYGTWYVETLIEEKDKDQWIEDLKDYDSLSYGWMIQEDVDDLGHVIGYVSKEIYELKNLKLIAGNYPQNDHEIMISTRIQEKMNYTLNQQITYFVDNIESQLYTIVGIVDDPNAGHATSLDIYTYSPSGHDYYIVSNQDINYGKHLSYNDCRYNPFGHTANEGIELFNVSSTQMIIFIEFLVLTLFALVSIASIMLQKRTQDFALLRGIGMTTKQLCIMVLEEIVFISILMVILGALLSLIIINLIMQYIAKEYGYFICQYDLFLMISIMGIIEIIVLLSCLYPIYQSSQTALSGTFDHQNFQYIQVRHRDPQYQTKWHLALRELFVHKRLSIVMMILWMIITIYYTCGIMNPQTTFSIHQSNPIDFHYLEYYPSSKREKDHLEALHLDQTMTYTYTMIEINQEEMTVGSLDHINLLKKSCIQGRVPIQENEIILLKHSDGNLTDLFKGYNIGDSLIMKGKEYQIVGFLLPNQVSTQDSFVVHDIYYMCDYDVYVLPQTFDILSQGKEYYHMRTYFELEDRENIEKKIRKHLYFDCINCSDDFFSSSLTGVAVFSDIDPLILMIPFIVCVCFCYFFNRNDLMIHHHDYDLYHLIGMTKQDILKKELWKAVFMTGVNMMVQLIWIIFINISYQIIMLPILEFLSTTLIVFVVTSLIYCLPLYSLFKYSNQEGSAKYV